MTRAYRANPPDPAGVGATGGSKRCPRCARTKPLGCFGRHPSYGVQSWCRVCLRVYHAEYARTEACKERRRPYDRARYADPGRKAQVAEADRRRRASPRGKLLARRSLLRRQSARESDPGRRARLKRSLAVVDAELERLGVGEKGGR